MTIETLDENDENLPLLTLPKTALQAIYHAVTGKTENLTRILTGNVIISDNDIDRLYYMLNDQLGLHEKPIDPTVTVVLKQARGKAITYSSWERYKALFVNSQELTSELTLKMEFVIALPQTPQPQRCIVNINLDSSLPVIADHKETSDQADSFGLLFFFKKEWRTVSLSIDFVDFLIAKSFSNLVEEWFQSLGRCPDNKLNNFLLNRMTIIRSISNQVGRIGFSTFIGTYLFLNWDKSISLKSISLAIVFGLFLWSMFIILETETSRRVFKRLSANIVPSVILLTEADSKAYERILSDVNRPIGTLFTAIIAFSIGIITNIVSSYLYTYLTSS